MCFSATGIALIVWPMWLPLALLRTIGLTLTSSLLVTVLVQRGTLTSVWCFFAAALSILLFIAVRREQPVIATAPAHP